jgi:hypothetical protein
MEECLRFAVCVAAACLTEANCAGGIQPLFVCLELGKAQVSQASPTRINLEMMAEQSSDGKPPRSEL